MGLRTRKVVVNGCEVGPAKEQPHQMHYLMLAIRCVENVSSRLFDIKR